MPLFLDALSMGKRTYFSRISKTAMAATTKNQGIEAIISHGSTGYGKQHKLEHMMQMIFTMFTWVV